MGLFRHISGYLKNVAIGVWNTAMQIQILRKCHFRISVQHCCKRSRWISCCAGQIDKLCLKEPKMWQSVKKRPVPDAQFPNNQPSNKHYQKPLDYFNCLAILSLFPLSFSKKYTGWWKPGSVVCSYRERAFNAGTTVGGNSAEEVLPKNEAAA